MRFLFSLWNKTLLSQWLKSIGKNLCFGDSNTFKSGEQRLQSRRIPDTDQIRPFAHFYYYYFIIIIIDTTPPLLMNNIE